MSWRLRPDSSPPPHVAGKTESLSALQRGLSSEPRPPPPHSGVWESAAAATFSSAVSFHRLQSRGGPWAGSPRASQGQAWLSREGRLTPKETQEALGRLRRCDRGNQCRCPRIALVSVLRASDPWGPLSPGATVQLVPGHSRASRSTPHSPPCQEARSRCAGATCLWQHLHL